MGFQIFGNEHLRAKMNFERLQAGMEIRVEKSVVEEEQTFVFQADVTFIEWDAKTGCVRCAYGKSTWLIPPQNILGQVITYTEKRVVPL